MIAGVLVVYVVLLALLWGYSRRHPETLRMRAALRLLPDLLRLIRRLAADPAVPRGVRVRLVLLLVYLASPIDLVPDVVPVLGYADDALVVALVLRSVVRRAGPDALRRHWPGTPEGLQLVQRLAGLPADHLATNGSVAPQCREGPSLSGATLHGVDDLLSGGPRQDRRPPPRWLLVTGAIVSAVAVVVVATWYLWGDSPAGGPRSVHARSGAAPATASSPGPSPAYCAGGSVSGLTSTPTSGGLAVALVIAGASPLDGALDRRDVSAASGPWAVVVRRFDGSLGRHGAVVTFPVDVTGSGRPVTVGGASGRATGGEVVWPIGGAHARVRGDLGETALLSIAAATQVVANRPAVHPPGGYRVVSSGPYRAPDIREVRYDGGRLVSSRILGGLVYTGVAALGGFEDQLYATTGTACGTVHGRPAVVSAVGGGDGTLAWQVAPGLVGYVGYSGSDLTGAVLGAVHQLGERTRPLNSRQWQAANPQVSDQRNDFG